MGQKETGNSKERRIKEVVESRKKQMREGETGKKGRGSRGGGEGWKFS